MKKQIFGNHFTNLLNEKAVKRIPSKFERILGVVGMRYNPVNIVSNLLRKYGDIVMLDDHIYLIGSSDLAETILSRTPNSFDRIIPESALTMRFYGMGLAVSERDQWIHRRRAIHPMIQQVNSAFDVVEIHKIATDVIERWERSYILDLNTELPKVTFSIAMLSIFGDNANRIEHDEIFTAIDEVFSLFNDPEQLVSSIETRKKSHFLDKIQTMDSIIYKIIDQRRNNGYKFKDILSVIMGIFDTESVSSRDRCIRDEIVAMLRSSHKNNANQLLWTIYTLTQHFDVRIQLQEEIDEVINEELPSLEMLSRLTYTEMVIKEVMRLYPLYPLINRYAVQDCKLGGYQIPAGSRLIISQWDIQRDRRYFEEPEVFNPERWRDGLEKRLSKYNYFPFSGGARRCPFESYAMVEIKLLLAIILRRFRVELVQGHRVKPKLSPNGLYPEHDIRVMVYKR